MIAIKSPQEAKLIYYPTIDPVNCAYHHDRLISLIETLDSRGCKMMANCHWVNFTLWISLVEFMEIQEDSREELDMMNPIENSVYSIEETDENF